MKRSALILISILTLSGCKQEPVEGQLTVSGSLRLRDAGGSVVEIGSGAARVTPNLRSVFRSTFRVDTAGHSFKFTVPKAGFDAAQGSFQVSAQKSGQAYSFRGRKGDRVIGATEWNGTSGCSTPGFCLGTGLNSKGELETSYGFHSSCPGSQPARFRKETYRTSYLVEALDGANPVARFEGESRDWDKVTSVPTGSCSQ